MGCCCRRHKQVSAPACRPDNIIHISAYICGLYLQTLRLLSSEEFPVIHYPYMSELGLFRCCFGRRWAMEVYGVLWIGIAQDYLSVANAVNEG